MGDFSLNDTVGTLLDVYRAREQAKLDLRLAQSREQVAAYDLAARYANPQADAQAMPQWLPLLGLGLLAGLVYVAVK